MQLVSVHSYQLHLCLLGAVYEGPKIHVSLPSGALQSCCSYRPAPSPAPFVSFQHLNPGVQLFRFLPTC